MQIIQDLDALNLTDGVVLTIGTFDGMHRGHQQLVRQLVARAQAQAWRSGILTFHPHPRAVLVPASRPTYLSTPEERAAIAESLGLDLFIMLPFDQELAATSAEAFIQRLCAKLNLRELWVGPDFALGRGRGGDVQALGALAESSGFGLRVLDAVQQGQEIVSSTRVRQAVATGDMAAATALLGRPYAVQAVVIPGAQRGRTMGFRTANLRLPPDRALPPYGVYAVWATIGEGRFPGLANGRWPGVANVGIRPSFDAGEVLVEVHLIDFSGDVYGQTMEVAFVARLRQELRFENVEALIAQMQRDTAQAREVLGVS